MISLRHALAVAACLLLLSPAAGYASGDLNDRPEVGGDVALLVNAEDGSVLYSLAPDRRHAIASLTKLMTALLTLKEAPLTAEFVAPEYNAKDEESKIDLVAGERMSVSELLYALLLESANDAAVTLAQGAAGSTPAFVADMNRRARQLGLRGTRYANPVGLDAPGNYSTAHDLVRLTKTLQRYPFFRKVVKTPEATLESGNTTRTIDNRNRLVGRYPYVTGVKTGHTLDAGYCLVGSGTKRGVKLISVVLGEPSEDARDADTLELLNYGFSLYRSRRVVREGRTYGVTKIRYKKDRVALVARGGLSIPVRRGQLVTVTAEAPRQADSVETGQPVGRAVVKLDGRRAGSVGLVPKESVGKANLFDVAHYYIKKPYAVIFLLVLLAVALIIRRVMAKRPSGNKR